MRELLSSVSPKGQVTIPSEIRRLLKIKPKDKVSFRVEGDEVRIMASRSKVDAIYRSVPALKHRLSDRELTDIAWEEHAFEVAKEGL